MSVCRIAFVSRLASSMEHPIPDFHDEQRCRNAKSPASCGGRASADLGLRAQPWFSEPRLYLLFDAFFLTRTGFHPASSAGPAFPGKRYDQPRVRERIMKLSKVYSATCHHRYWSER